MEENDKKLTPKQLLKKYGFKGDISKIKDKKYNKWCETKFLPPVPSELKDWLHIEKTLREKGLSKFERLALYINKRTKCDGIEFDVFSDNEIKKPTIFDSSMILFPCFQVNLDGKSLKDPKTHETLKQMQNARYEYDGWIPVEKWDEEGVRNAIRKIDEVFSVFTLLTSRYFHWHPKYIEHVDQKSSTLLNDENIELIKNYSSFIDALPPNDKWIMYRSIGWFYQSFRVNDPLAKFLFRIVSIESLATYIESKKNNESILKSFRTNNFTLEEKNKCIEEIISKLYDTDKIKAIREAYNDCVGGIKKTVKNHLENVLSDKRRS